MQVLNPVLSAIVYAVGFGGVLKYFYYYEPAGIFAVYAGEAGGFRF